MPHGTDTHHTTKVYRNGEPRFYAFLTLDAQVSGGLIDRAGLPAMSIGKAYSGFESGGRERNSRSCWELNPVPPARKQ
jgi:hypothetical protein